MECVATSPIVKATNLVILGKQGAGKTTIFRQFNGYFGSASRGPSKDVNQLEVLSNRVRLVISDLNLPPLLNASAMFGVAKGDAFIIVYDVTDNHSFDYAEQIKDYLVRIKGKDCPIIFVGNKTDLPGRLVRYELADCLISVEWEMSYFETSAILEDSVPVILESVFSVKREKQFVPSTDGDLDMFELRGIKFRPRAKTDSNLCKPREKTNSDRITCLVERGIIPEPVRQRKASGRHSLPNFSFFKISKSNRDEKPVEEKKKSPLMSRFFKCIRRQGSVYSR